MGRGGGGGDRCERLWNKNGLKIIAADTVYHFNDEFFGQWMGLHVPFRVWSDLEDEQVKALVPPRLRHFAHALKVCETPGKVPEHLRNFWRRPDKVEAELKHQAKTGDYIEDVLAMVAGQIHLVDQYLNGIIRADEEADAAAAGEAGDGGREERHVYNTRQKWLGRNIDKRLATAMQANHGATEEERDAGLDIAWQRGSPII